MTQPLAEFNSELELWFVTGSQALYGDEALETVASQSQQVFQQLAPSLDGVVSIVWKPVLTTPDAIRRQLLDATATDTCVGVVAWMHTFSPAKMWISGLLALDKPLLHLHTQLNLSLPWSEIDMDFMNLNQAAHGDREFAHITTRLGLPRTVVVGHVEDTRVSERVASWARATTGWHAARSLKLARFGDNMREVAVTEGDKVEAQAKLGISVNTYAVHDLAIAVAEVEDTEVDQLVENYGDSYSLDRSLHANGARHASLRYEARVELALRSLLVDGGFSAFTTNFEDLGALEQLPGLAVQRLMADGYGFGAEGDWKTAALLRVLKVMGAGQEGGASFMEDYTYHLGPGEPRILGAHMLEVCPSISLGKPSCEIHPLAIGDRGDPVRLVFDAKPGPALVVGLVDLGDRLRLVANQVNIVAPNEPLKRLPSARAVWAPEPSLAVSAECWLLAGGPHHTVLTTSVDAECLAEFAEITQIELVMIDSDTSPRRFRDEERWNRAYWRLAKPI